MPYFDNQVFVPTDAASPAGSGSVRVTISGSTAGGVSTVTVSGTVAVSSTNYPATFVSASVVTLPVSASDGSGSITANTQRYLVVSSIDCFLNWGAAATTSTFPLPAKTPLELVFPNASVHAVTAAGTGTVYFTPVRVS